MMVSVAGIPRNAGATVALLAGGVLLVGVFLRVDRRGGPSVLPPSAFRPGPLKWIYLTLGLLMAATMADMYVPLFGQRLAHLVPVVAGFLGVALSVGWTFSEIASASVSRTRVDRAHRGRRPVGDGARSGAGGRQSVRRRVTAIGRRVGAGAVHHRLRCRDGLAAPVGLGDGQR